MKLPRKSKQWLREIEDVVDAAYQQLEAPNQSQKQQFEAVFNVVIDKITKNRGIEKARLLEKTNEIVEALAGYLRSTPETSRDWTGIIAFLYIKFHQVLGLINEQQMLRILISQ